MRYKLPGVLVAGGLVVGSGTRRSQLSNIAVTIFVFTLGVIVGWLLGR